jgi:4-diphosphocytidyl-2C-methyl-D-erythritol kinase
VHGVNTGAAYGALAAQRDASGAAPGARRFQLTEFSSWTALARMAMNDFETVVPLFHEGVATVLPQLRALASADAPPDVEQETRIALMSGSGATCFLLASDATSLRVPADWQVTFTRTT